MHSLLLCLFVILWSGFFSASVIADNAADNHYQLVGEAKLQVLFWKVYRARLYSENGSYQEDLRPLTLNIRYKRNIKSKKLIEYTRKQWDYFNIDHAIYKPWLEEIAFIWPDVKKGDELSLVVDESNRSQFYLNGDAIGMVENKLFSQAFLAIWFSENSKYPKLAKRLTGGRSMP